MSIDVWTAIAAERADLVDALASLPDGAWDKPSLCEGWTVADTIAHLVTTAEMTPPRFFRRLAGSGFNFAHMTSAGITDVRRRAPTPSQLTGLLRARVDARTAPPGPTLSWLGETIVHGEDVFRALGSYRDHSVEHVVAVADFYRGSNLLIGTKRRIDGVRLRATDADWTQGSGPEARGPAIALLLAMTGRKTALDDLTGEGVAVLRSRP